MHHCEFLQVLPVVIFFLSWLTPCQNWISWWPNMHDARVPQVGGKLFHTLACRVTSRSGSWKPFYMPIMHHQSLNDQSFLSGLTVISNRCFISRLEISNWPLVCRWYGVATLCVMEYFVKRALNALLQKWAPLSLIIARGNPKRETMLLFKNPITTLWSLVLHGIAFTHFNM